MGAVRSTTAIHLLPLDGEGSKEDDESFFTARRAPTIKLWSLDARSEEVT